MFGFIQIYKNLRLMYDFSGKFDFLSSFFDNGFFICLTWRDKVLRHSVTSFLSVTDVYMWFYDHRCKQTFFLGFMMIQDIPAAYVRHLYPFFTFGKNTKFVIPNEKSSKIFAIFVLVALVLLTGELSYWMFHLYRWKDNSQPLDYY